MARHRHRHKRRTNRSLNDPINRRACSRDQGEKNKTLLAGFSRAAINTSWQDLKRKSWPMRMAHHFYFRDADESLTVRFPSCFLSKLSFITVRGISSLLDDYFFLFLLLLSINCFVLRF